MMDTKKLVLLSILLAISIVLNIVERLMLGGLTGLPMVRLGLSNIIILMVIYLYQSKDALLLLILRVFLVGVFTSLFSPMFFLSLGGGLMAFIGMYVGHKVKVFSMIGVSVLGAFGHALGQILMAIVLLETESLIVYFPWLVAISIPTGILNGIISSAMYKFWNKNFNQENL